MCIIQLPWGQRATRPRKETRRKEQRRNGAGKRAKPSPPPTQAIDARMGEEEQNIRKKLGTQPPGPFGRLLRPAWIIRRAYS